LTNAQVLEVVANAAVHGRSVDEYQATTFLGAKEILAIEPDNEAAADTVAEFCRFITEGRPMTSFSRFTLPVFYTDESKAESARLREEFLAHQAKR
jgi:hypothetical protein